MHGPLFRLTREEDLMLQKIKDTGLAETTTWTINYYPLLAAAHLWLTQIEYRFLITLKNILSPDNIKI